MLSNPISRKKYLCLKKWIFKEPKNQFPFNTLVGPMGSTPTTPELYIFIKYNTYFPFGQNSKKKTKYETLNFWTHIIQKTCASAASATRGSLGTWPRRHEVEPYTRQVNKKRKTVLSKLDNRFTPNPSLGANDRSTISGKMRRISSTIACIVLNLTYLLMLGFRTTAKYSVKNTRMEA